MNSPSQVVAHVEVETKFAGGSRENEAIIAWLASAGFTCTPLAPKHRVHVYYDDGHQLLDAGCRLRCVIASGEWCRYDFKAPGADGLAGIVEASVTHPAPVPVTQAVTELLQQLPQDVLGNPLKSITNTLAITLVMTGAHRKTVAECDALKLEVSWDVVVPLDSGIAMSEVEVELLHGELPAFESLVQRMAKELSIQHHDESKYARAVRAAARPPPCSQSTKSVTQT